MDFLPAVDNNHFLMIDGKFHSQVFVRSWCCLERQAGRHARRPGNAKLVASWQWKGINLTAIKKPTYCNRAIITKAKPLKSKEGGN